ncbi:MAG: hypothetical protein DI585_03115, partial [Pseudomonas fluorescens]
TETAKHILETKTGANQAVAVYDTSVARDRQVRTSNERMEVLAEQLYAFYAGKYRFPNESEFTTLSGKLDLHDAWGNAFTYKQVGKGKEEGQKATLSFTTPWNYTQTLNLALKDETDTANNRQNNETENDDPSSSRPSYE